MTKITKSALAKLAGVSRPAISKLIRNGRLPVGSDGMIDPYHPDCVEYLERVSRPSGGSAVLAARRQAEDGVQRDRKIIEKQKNATHNEIMSRQSVEMWKLEEQARQLTLKNNVMVGKLIPRDLVQRAVIDPLETEQARILSDGCSSIAALVVPAVKRGDAIEIIEKIIREKLETYISARKRTIERLLVTYEYEGSPVQTQIIDD